MFKSAFCYSLFFANMNEVRSSVFPLAVSFPAFFQRRKLTPVPQLKRSLQRSFFVALICFLSAAVYAQPTTSVPVYPSSFTVAKDGSGNFKTVQEAINAVRDLSQQQVTIFIKNGIYHEKVVVPTWKTNITLKGESVDSTIITWNDYSGKPYKNQVDAYGKDKHSTYASYTMLVQGNDFSAQNLTIENAAGPVGQAVALHIEADRVSIYNCKLLGHQDTLYLAKEGGRNYFENCLITGTTDFIFGEATAVFQSCTIKSLKNSFITAAATRPSQKYGFVFFDCRLIGDTAATKVYLGRPWRPHAKTVFIITHMDDHIRAEGWDNWRNAENEKTVLYAEYNSTGPGANAVSRVKWSKQLTRKEMKDYTLEKIFCGQSNWVPVTNKR